VDVAPVRHPLAGWRIIRIAVREPQRVELAARRCKTAAVFLGQGISRRIEADQQGFIRGRIQCWRAGAGSQDNNGQQEQAGRAKGEGNMEMAMQGIESCTVTAIESVQPGGNQGCFRGQFRFSPPEIPPHCARETEKLIFANYRATL